MVLSYLSNFSVKWGGNVSRIKTFLRRVASGSIKRFLRNLETVHKESGRNRIVLFFDMIYCMFVYDVGYLDYLTFGFAYIKKDKRRTFMTMNDNIALTRQLNQREAYPVLEDKLVFHRTFGKLLGRSHADLRDGFAGFKAFCSGKETIFVKQLSNFGGLGVQKITLEGQDLRKLYDELVEHQMYLAEETIVQHPQMCQLCQRSVNTIRIVTILSDKGNANLVYALLRIGSGINDVDNVTSGGMYTLLSPEGRISHPAFCDKTVTYYTVHPVSGQPLIGFQVPYFDEAVDLCRQAALIEPRMRYVGWDVAITPTGPVLVEGNDLPGYDMCQNHRFHDDGRGIKAAFDAAIQN